MPERQRHLDQACDTSGGFEVAHVGLDRPQCARPFPWTFDAKHCAQRFRLDRVAQQCARTVGLDVLNLAGRDGGLPIGFSHDRFLSQRIRRHKPVAPSVLVHGAAANDGINRITIRQGFREGLQHDDTGALTANVAIGPGIERFAASIRRHGAGFGEIDRNRRRENQVHTPGKSQRGLAVSQAAAGQVDGNERRGTGRVDGDTRPAEIEQVRDSVGGDARGIAGAGVGINSLEIIPLQPAIIVGRDADEYAGLGADQTLGHLPRVL